MPSTRALIHAPWSASKVATALRCPRLFHYKYVDKIREPEVNPEARIGKAIHRALELSLHGRPLSQACGEAITQLANEDEVARFEQLATGIPPFLTRIGQFRKRRRVQRQLVEYSLAVREDLTFGVRVRAPGAEGEREVSWLGSSGARALSADGSKLLMVDIGQRSGPTYGVVLRDTNGPQAVRLGAGNAERLSPDGRWAAAIAGTPPEVVLYPTGSGAPRRLAASRLNPISSVQWFPDGTHLLVCGSEAGKRPRCFRADLEGSTFTPVTDEGVRASVAPDGATLLLTMNDGAVHVGRMGAADSRPIASLRGSDHLVGWSRDSRAVFVQGGFEVPVAIERVDLATGLRTTTATIAPDGVARPASVFVADWVDEGRWYAYNYTTVPSVLFLATGITP